MQTTLSIPESVYGGQASCRASEIFSQLQISRETPQCRYASSLWFSLHPWSRQFVYPGNYYWSKLVATNVLMALSARSCPLKTGRRKTWKQARRGDSVYLISFSDKFQTHSNHSLSKPHISPINRCSEYHHSIAQTNAVTYPSSTKRIWQAFT